MWRLLRAVRYRRPGTEPVGLRHQAAHFLRCLVHIRTFRAWFGDTSNPALNEALGHRPSLAAFAIHPYVHLGWGAERKLAVIAEHYAMLRAHLSFLRMAPGTSIVLATTTDGLQIRLDKLDRFAHEGELTFNLFDEHQRLYTLVFTLGRVDSQCVVFVGALQGIHSPDALEIYRLLTQRMHGLRPRDLLVTAFRGLCGCLAVERILAISDHSRVSTSPYFTSAAQVLTSYDTVWIENGAEAAVDGFFELTPAVERREGAQVPARKRALYRRRYAMVDALNLQIGLAVARATAG